MANSNSTSINPFSIDVSDHVLDDLRRRLNATRWPEKETVEDWSQGVPLEWIKSVCRYWAEAYAWRKRESALNRFEHFTAELTDIKIHLIHRGSPNPDARTLDAASDGQ